MVDDFWSMDRCSQDSNGKCVVWRQNSRRSENPGKYMENPIFPEDEGSQKGDGDGPQGAHTTPWRGLAWPAPPGGVAAPDSVSDPFSPSTFLLL